MDNRGVVIATCSCAVPLPQQHATHKGAAHTNCERCGLPIRLDFATR